MRGRPPKLTDDVIDALVARYKAGITVTDIAIEFNMALSTVTKGLHEGGISAGINGTNAQDYASSIAEVNKDIEDVVIADYKSGCTIRQLQLKHRINHIVLAQILTKHGLRKALPIKGVERQIQKPRALSNGSVLSEEKQLSLIEDYLSHGFPRNVLAIRYKIPIELVTSTLRIAGIPAMRTIVPQELEEKICEDYKTGFMTPYDLGKIYDLTPTSIRYVLAKNHLTSVDVNGKLVIGNSMAQAKKLARDATEDIMQMFIDSALDPTVSVKDRHVAGIVVLDRAMGKVKEPSSNEDVSKSSSVHDLIPEDKRRKWSGQT